MGFVDRAGQACRGLVALVRHPKTVVRFAFHLDRDDGFALGGMLRRQLSPAARRQLGAEALARDDVILQFEGGGFVWTVPSGDVITGGLLSVGEYTASELEALLAWFQDNSPLRGDTVVEVGANVGSTTLPLARNGWRVLAVEPVPATLEFLRLNVHRNHFDAAVTCVQCAVSRDRGSATMAVSYRAGANRLIRGTAIEGDGSSSLIEVEVRPLAGIVADAGLTMAQLAFVWCDAEGSEIDVIQGGEELWAAGVPLYAECGTQDGGTPDEFAATAERYFAYFIPELTLLREGSKAVRRPIQEVRLFLAGLERQQNALFLP